MNTTSAPSAYPYQAVVASRFTDLDTSGFIGHIGLARYQEDARAELLYGLIKGHGGDLRQWRAVLCRASTEIFEPVRYPAPIRVGAGIAGVGNRSYGIEVAMFQEGVLLCRARSVSVAVSEDHRSRRIPEEVRVVMNDVRLAGRDWTLGEKPDAAQRKLEDHSYRLQLPTRFGDTDALGHINNVAALRYCEEGVVGALGAEHRKQVMVVHLEVSYLREARFGPDIIVGTSVRKIDDSHTEIVQSLFQDGQCVATCESVVRLISAPQGRAEAASRRLG